MTYAMAFELGSFSFWIVDDTFRIRNSKSVYLVYPSEFFACRYELLLEGELCRVAEAREDKLIQQWTKEFLEGKGEHPAKRHLQ